jgi:predicted thioesterase
VKAIFKPGDKKQTSYVVQYRDVAAFNDEVVHPVCATFTLAREIEWSTRQFVLDMREDDEEGIGTFLSVDHKGPAFIGECITFHAWVEQLEGNELICGYEARIGERLIASGRTGQKILKREKLQKLFTKHE